MQEREELVTIIQDQQFKNLELETKILQIIDISSNCNKNSGGIDEA